MKVFLRCACGTRDSRARGCTHKWASQFKYKGAVVPLQTAFVNKQDAIADAIRQRDTWIKRAKGLPVDDDEPQGAQHLGSLRDQFLPIVEARGNAGTYRSYKWALDMFVQILGAATLLHTITVADIERWRQTRRAQPSPRRRLPQPVLLSTVNKETTAVQAMFRHAGLAHRLFGKEVVIQGQKLPGIRKWKAQKHVRKHRPLTAAELAVAYAKLPDPFDLICRVTHESLARLSEVTWLKRGDVGTSLDVDGALIGWMIRMQKGGETVRIALPIHLAMQLLARPTSPASPYLFPGLQNDQTSNKLRRLFDRIGLSCSHHAFKHTGITAAMDSGQNLQSLQQQAGWTSLAQLPTYGHVTDAAARRLVDGNAATVATILGQIQRDPLPLRRSGGQVSGSTQGKRRRRETAK